MKTFVLFFITLLFLQSCSYVQPKNQWQYQTTSSLKAYIEHYLEGNTLRARSDLKNAREEASRSAALHTLIDVELSVCATDISILKPNPCPKASKLLKLDPDTNQKAYFDLLNNQLSPVQIDNLPSRYQNFAASLLAGDIETINNTIHTIEPITSRLLASALIKDKLSNKNIQNLIDTLSYHGYKQAILAWLTLQIDKEEDPKKQENLIEKRKVLISH